jgi:hypothetical protein
MIRVYFILVLFIANISNAAFLSNDFVITSEIIKYKKYDERGVCNVSFSYPLINRTDTEAVDLINSSIKNFTKTYKPCNATTRSGKHDVRFRVDNGSRNYFSVVWRTVFGDDLLVRVDSINFNKNDGTELTIGDIFKSLDQDTLKQFISLSKGRLLDFRAINWQNILELNVDHKIQFYVKDNSWYAVFNTNYLGIETEVLEIELPKNLTRE